MIVGTGAVIASQTDFQSISFDFPFEWQATWNDFSANVSNMWSDISHWWNGLFNYTSNLASAETEVNNSFSLIDYYLLQSIQDPYARPNLKKQGLRLIFDKDIPDDFAIEIRKYVKYLRQLYFFQ